MNINVVSGGCSNPSPEPVDKTNLLVIDIMRKKPTVQFEFLKDGNIRFKLPLAGTVMANPNLAHAKLLQTHWFANSVGEYLVRCNLACLDEAVSRADYPELAAKQIHTNFGLRLKQHHLEFQFHCQLLHRLFNERLRWELREVNA
jgi:hypothetical protein